MPENVGSPTEWREQMSEERNEYTPDLYTLVDEDGKEQTFEMLDALEVDGTRYFALIPYEADPEALLADDCDLVILKADLVDGEEMLVSIEDDEEFEKIGDMFLKRLDEMFEEEGCCCDDDCGCEHGACDCCGHEE